MTWCELKAALNIHGGGHTVGASDEEYAAAARGGRFDRARVSVVTVTIRDDGMSPSQAYGPNRVSS